MKAIAILITGLLSAVAFAFPGVPDGTFTGKGRMKTAGGLDREYAARLTIQGNGIEASYDYGDGKNVKYAATVQPTSALEFQVTEAGEVVGKGYCDNSLCHLEVPRHHAEETWFLQGTSLTRVGSMDHGATKVVYTEKLSSVALGLRGEEKLFLECEGFEHSDTVKVRLYRAGVETGSLIEVAKDGKEAKRMLSKEELSADAYKISPIYEIDRVIKRKGTTWVLAYGCGEERPLSCTEHPTPAGCHSTSGPKR